MWLKSLKKYLDEGFYAIWIVRFVHSLHNQYHLLHFNLVNKMIEIVNFVHFCMILGNFGRLRSPKKAKKEPVGSIFFGKLFFLP